MNSKVKFKLKTPIIILSIIALVFRIISSITYFVNYDYIKYGEYELNISFPPFVSLISLIIALAPIVLFLIYIIKFHKDFKATICVPIVFGLIAFAPIYSIIRNLIIGYGFYFADLISNLFIIAPFVLATISALKGFSKKSFTIIAFSISFLLCVFSIISIFTNISYYLRSELYIYLITSPCSILGTISFYISLFLFAMNNRIPAVLTPSPEQEKKSSEKMSPEQSLRLLKDKLDFGMITEEEYQAQRAEIISKL